MFGMYIKNVKVVVYERIEVFYNMFFIKFIKIVMYGYKCMIIS